MNTSMILYTLYIIYITTTSFKLNKISSRILNILYSSKRSTFGSSKSSKASPEVYYCDNCGVEHIKWIGKCTACHEWNTVKAFKKPSNVNTNAPLDLRLKLKYNSNNELLNVNQRSESLKWINNQENNDFIALDSINSTFEAARMNLKYSKEMNRVLGGGLSKGSVILLVGDPGIGKSTLIIQLASSLAQEESKNVIYVSGEETSDQIASRANRLSINTKGIYIVNDVDIDSIIDKVTSLSITEQPCLMIIDSIQTVYTSTCPNSVGSVSQIRESTAKIIQFAKITGISSLLIGHVTKSGDVAGPRVLGKKFNLKSYHYLCFLYHRTYGRYCFKSGR